MKRLLILTLTTLALSTSAVAQQGWDYNSRIQLTADVYGRLFSDGYIAYLDARGQLASKYVKGKHDISHSAGELTKVSFNLPSVYPNRISAVGSDGQCFSTKIDATAHNSATPLDPVQDRKLLAAGYCIPRAAPPRDPGSGACRQTETNNCQNGDPRNNQDGGQAGYACPIVVSLDGTGYRFTSLDGGVKFDIDANGKRDQVSWTKAGKEIAFLWFDRNGNGKPDDGGELFGDSTKLANGNWAQNGFEALREFDSNKDGAVTVADDRWSRLRLWVDRNHNGRADTSELSPLSESRIVSLDLNYRWTGRLDDEGNWYRLKSRMELRDGTFDQFFDIFFVR